MSLPPIHVSIPAGSVLAIYAAVMSTITGAVQLLTYRHDRAQVKLSVGHSMQIMGDPRYTGKTLTIVKVLNEGRRPVTITTVGATRLYPNSHFVIVECQPPLPYELTEGKSLMAILPASDKMDLSAIGSWEALDAVGRTYRLHAAPWHARALSYVRLHWERRQKRRIKKKSSGGE